MAVAVEILVLVLLYNHTIEWEKLGLFAFTQSTILQFWTPDFLRGYGCGTSNVYLWTICVLIKFYIVVFFVYKWHKGKSWKIWVLAFMLFVGVFALTLIFRGALPKVAGKLYGQTFIPYFWMFIAWTFVSEFKTELLPLIKRYWWLAFAITFVFMYTSFDYSLCNYGLLKSLSLFVCLLGFVYAVPQVNIKTDI